MAEGWGLERGVGATRPGMKQDTIAKDATRNCGVEGGRTVKYCMDCQFFGGNLTAEDREFLFKLLRSYHSNIMLNSWVKLGQTKKPSGKNVDPDKAKGVKILNRSKGLCRKEHVRIFALEQGCVFWHHGNLLLEPTKDIVDLFMKNSGLYRRNIYQIFRFLFQ